MSEFSRALLSALLTAGVAFVLAAPAVADSVIDTTPGNGTVSSLGPQLIFGQSFLAQGTLLEEVVFSVGHHASDDAIFNFFITGAREDTATTLGWSPDLTDIRFEGGAVDVPVGTSMAPVTFSPSLTVLANERLFLVFDAFSYPEGQAGTPGQAEFSFNVTGDAYEDGEFLYTYLSNTSGETCLADFNLREWTHQGGRDLAFKATFSGDSPTPVVPLPPAGLTGLALLAGIGLLRRARRR